MADAGLSDADLFAPSAAPQTAAPAATAPAVGDESSGMPPAPHLTMVGSSGGATAQVNAEHGWRFAGLIHDLETNGYKVDSLGGFNQRDVAGTNIPSYHASGLALDVNPSHNGRGTQGDIPPDLARRVAQRWGFGWGGDFHNNPDPMHFSLAAHEGGTVPVDPGGATVGQPAPAGLSADEQAQWEALQPGAPTTEPGKRPGTSPIFHNVQGGPLTAAQEKWYAAKAASPGGLDISGIGTDLNQGGTAGLPYALTPGYPLPSTPGAHYIDFDGVEHVVPGGLGAKVGNTVQGVLQGLGPDTAASADKLTGGGLGVPSAEPGFIPTGALSELAHPGFNEATRQGALAGMEDQQRRYAFAHAGDEYAAGGRFGGQIVPGTLAAAAVPEIKLPGMAADAGVGVLSRVASRGLTNAARGAAATAPSVGTSDAPVPEQLATGAAAGLLGPEAIGAAGRVGSAMTGVGKTVAPEVADLARTAADKYGIKLRAGQIEAAGGDRAAGFRDSQLATAPGSGVSAGNVAQHRALSAALAGTIGEPEAAGLTPAVMENARQRIGGVFDDVASRTGFRADPQLATDLGRITTQARELGLDQSQINALDAQVQKITDLTATHGEVIPGNAYQSITQKGSSLSRIMDSDHGAFGDLAHDIRGAIDDAVSRASSPEDVAALQQARLQWKNLKTLQPLAAKASPEGYVSPALLRGRVSSQFDNFAYGGGGDLGELARIGQLMKEPPNSGTANRLGEMMKGGAFGAAGTGILMTALHDPALGGQMAAGAAALAGLRYGSNAVRGALNDNPLVRASLLRGGQPQEGALAAMAGVRNAVRPTEVPLSALAAHSLIYSPADVVRGTTEYQGATNAP